MSEFDPYHKWLGIPPKDRPPNHYRLLGVELFESDPDVIEAAAEQRMAYINQCATGPHLVHSQKLLNEIAAARVCLLNPQEKVRYDLKLKSQIGVVASSHEQMPLPRKTLPTPATIDLREPKTSKPSPNALVKSFWVPLLGVCVIALSVAGAIWFSIPRGPNLSKSSMQTAEASASALPISNRPVAASTPQYKEHAPQSLVTVPTSPQLQSLPGSSSRPDVSGAPVSLVQHDPNPDEVKVSGSLPSTRQAQSQSDSKRAFDTIAGVESRAIASSKSLPAVPSDAATPALLDGTRAGQEWAENGPKIIFCWCPPGEFMMGSPKTEPDRRPNEAQALVKLTSGFWIGKYEVTQAQWKHVMGFEPWQSKGYVGNQSECPAVYISWNDATKFCNNLTELEHQAFRLPADYEYRLPTEAEWEYACRAGTTTRFNFGNDETGIAQHAWIDKRDKKAKPAKIPKTAKEAKAAKDAQELYAHAVGLKQPNRWGLHDMHGNVWEWCVDVLGPKLPGGEDPLFVGKGAKRTNRGGSWCREAKWCRTALREGEPPTNRDYSTGLRVVLAPLN